jgi:hypothetical protein
MAGVPIAAATKFLGHGTIEMTMRYAHLQPENNDRAVAAMMSFYPAKTKINVAPNVAPVSGRISIDR